MLRNLLVIVAVLLLGALAQQPFTANKLHTLKRVSGPVVSPRGDYAVFSVRVWNPDTKKTATNLELVLVNTTSSARTKTLTPSQEGVTDFSPVFSPDGKYVFFLSTRGGDNVQIFTVPVYSSFPQIQQISKFPVDVDNLKISPMGNFVTFSAEVYIDCTGDILACTAQRNAQQDAKGPNTGIVYSQLYVRHWDKWETPGKHSHIFMMPITIVSNKDNELVIEAGQTVDLMQGMNAACPIPPFGGAEQYDISPKGDEISFTAEDTSSSKVAWTTGWKTYRISTVQGSSPSSITEFTKARTTNPVYSPDGRYIAYLAMDRPGLESDRFHVNLYDRVSGNTNPVTANIDKSFGAIEWLSDGRTLILDADDDAEHKLYAFDIQSKQLTELVGTQHNDGQVQVPGKNRIVFSRNSMNTPNDIWQFDLTTDADSKLTVSNLIQITNYNADALKQIWMSTPEKFYFTGANNERVQGWLLRPIQTAFNQTGKYPLAFLIHGGPEGAWDSAWSYRWNPQLWASRGYVTVMINPHGSTGFGQNFTDAVRGRWGGWPYEDLMKGLDYVTQTYSIVDSQRMCACGGSYGGYMINWINGQNNGKFKCLVNHDGVFDAVAMAYSTEELWFSEAENGGLPYENPELFEKWNPRNYVKTMNTPTLIVHGGMDFRIPIAEGLSTFTALQRRGIPSKLLFYPMENHWVLKPDNSIMWYANVLGWLDDWTDNTFAKKLEAHEAAHHAKKINMNK